MEDPRAKASRLPEQPGIYRFFDADGRLLYVGKAKVLKRRVASYFQKTPDSPKTQLLVSRIASLDCIVTETEREALLLEDNLIKRHKPPFNIQLRDSKRYPLLAITTHEDFPRLIKTRSEGVPGDTYFGPYPSVSVITHTSKLLHRLFPIRYCDKRLVDGEKNGTVCIYYHIGRCLGPCELQVSKAQYGEYVRRAILFLTGEHELLIHDLEQAMRAHAANQEYEQAATARDQAQAIREVAEFQAVHRADLPPGEDTLDVVGLAENAGLAAFCVLQYRGGKLSGQRLFVERDAAAKPEPLAQFLRAWYATEETPGIVVVPDGPDREALAEELPPGVRALAAGDPGCSAVMRRLLAHARANAELGLEDEVRVRLHGAGLEELRVLLGLPALPQRIEGFDIATTLGEETVASMVSFKGGRPDRSQYRIFRMRTVDGMDDFASMQEAVARRYTRLLNENKPLPDLVLIDGGLGQLGAAKAALNALGLETLPVAALAKREELVYLPGRDAPLALDRHHFAIRILQSVRDEAHRFGTTHHVKRRDEKRLASRLDAIPGVGPETRKKLLTTFGSVAGLAQADPAAIGEAIGNKRITEAVIAWLAAQKVEEETG